MKLPQRPLTNSDLLKYAKHVPYFRGVYMKNLLPPKPWKNESGIINLDSSSGPGTHWVAYRKRGSRVQYFDSFGNLRPPKEVINYFRGSKIYYNYEKHQKYNTFSCGHLCLKFIHEQR